MFGAARIYGLDIETDNSEGFGLDPRNARVTEVAVSVDESIDSDGGAVFAEDNEVDLFTNLNSYLSSLPAGLLSTWNGAVFDLPFLDDRMRLCPQVSYGGLQGPVLCADPQIVPKYEPLPGHAGGYSAIWHRLGSFMPHQHLDVAQAYRAVAEAHGVKWSLKPVCGALGIKMVEEDRENLHLLSPARRRAYCLSDSGGTRQLALRVLGLA